MHVPIGDQQNASQPGLVISYFGNSVAVETPSGQVFQCHLRRNQPLPVVGDRVEWEMVSNETGRILHILPRRSILRRGEGHGKTRELAANIDLIIVVMAPLPIFSAYLVDRYLLAAELLNLPAMLVLNKIDLLDQADYVKAKESLAPYKALPYAVHMTSMLTDTGVDDLRLALKEKSAVLVGPSGVGKSSIIVKLSDHADIRIGALSQSGAGKHTTTASRLYHLPTGGQLIDSPGVREFNLWPVTPEDVLRGFKEFAPFVGQCKFRDCKHHLEPACGVQAAVEAGKISPTRFANYHALLRDAKNTTK